MAKTETAVEAIAATARDTEAIEVVIGEGAVAAIVATEAEVTFRWEIEFLIAIDLTR